MEHVVAKSQVTAEFAELSREVERTGQELIITDQGKPVLKLVPFAEKTEAILDSLRGSVVRYVQSGLVQNYAVSIVLGTVILLIYYYLLI